RNGHKCVVFDQNPSAISSLAALGATASDDLSDLADKLPKPRVIWLMLPAGEITEHTVSKLAEILDAGDIIIDGGNAFYKDDIRRAQVLKPKGIHYVDCGTSGGVWGLDRGYCLMIGGDKDVIEQLDPIFSALAPGTGSISRTPKREGRDSRVERGYMHCGPAGSGRFVKMIHNGIEYGLMQAYAEGFEILSRAQAQAGEGAKFNFDLADVAEVWRRGSVVSSWLLDLTAIAFAADPELKSYSGFVEDSGEGRWTLMAAIEENVPANVLAASLNARFRSREEESLADKLLSAMRHNFGGHVEPKT
ncbi:MAG TPA: decarboxylating 6-phosphogluconate dehydrogenase, partial [Candidatus Acidoferrum sp.]|nr:decarboxylating 6-phosphogluconate dehydrogenase [Candidatus Acidoferrum sp.]